MDTPLPPPGLVPLPPPAPPASAESRPPTPTSYTCECGVTVTTSSLEWIAVGSLSLALVLTFFSWIGTFPGGVRVYTQTPWEAIVGTVSNQTLFPESLDEVKLLKKLTPGNWLLLVPYVVALVAALKLAWLKRLGIHPKAASLPSWLRWWPVVQNHQRTLMTGFAVAAFVLLVMQSWRGFGLDVAIQSRIDTETAAALAAQPKGKDMEPIPLTPFQHGERIGHYSLSYTTALDLALLAQLIAAVSLAAGLWLDRRSPSAPSPQIIARS